MDKDDETPGWGDAGQRLTDLVRAVLAESPDDIRHISQLHAHVHARLSYVDACALVDRAIATAVITVSTEVLDHTEEA